VTIKSGHKCVKRFGSFAFACGSDLMSRKSKCARCAVAFY